MPYSAHQSRGGEVVVLFNGWCEVRRWKREQVEAAMLQVDTWNGYLGAPRVDWERWKHATQRKRREIECEV